MKSIPTRLKNRFEQLRRFLSLSTSMLGLVWQAQPHCFAGLLILQLLQGLFPLATAWITKSLFDLLSHNLQAGAPTHMLRAFAPLLVAQVVLVLASQLNQPLITYLNSELQRRLTLKVQSQIYQKVNSLSGLAPFEDPQFYNTIQLATQGAQFRPFQMLNTLLAFAQNATTLFAFAGVLLAFNPLLASAVTLAVLPQLYAQIKIGGQRFALAIHNTPRERRAWYYGQVLSTIDFAKEVRIFNLGGYFLRAFQGLTGQIHEVQRQQGMRELKYQAGLACFSGLVSVGMFAAVALQALQGRISLGDVSLYLGTVSSVQVALAGLVYALASANESALFYTQFRALQALPQPMDISLSPRPVPALTTGIALRNVSFRYSEAHPWVLRNANLFIPAHRCLALVGLNGAGKTTLVKLLTRLYDPTEGAILWDGIDLRAFDPTELRRSLGAVFQDFARYELSALENIGLGDVQHIEDRQRIAQVAQQVGIASTIASLPQGYDTILSRWLAENGSGADLSGGEWQKIAIARMFMRGEQAADLLILDEPTAALDAQAEYDVYQHFTELMQGHTSLLISHRFSTVRMADAIAVLEDGRFSEYGSHDELFGLGGTYTALYNMQAERYR